MGDYRLAICKAKSKNKTIYPIVNSSLTKYKGSLKSLNSTYKAMI